MAFMLPSYHWTPSPNFSSRGGATVDTFVLHDCEGNEDGSISWFAQARSRVSAHGVLSADGLRFTGMVAWANKAWHACNANPYSESLEMAGFEAKGFGSPEWQAAANVIAFRIKARGLPPKWTRGARGGFCSHYDLGAMGGGHFDPTRDPSKMLDFERMVQAAYADPEMPSAWSGASSTPPTPAPVAPPGWAPHGTVRHDHPVGSMEWVQIELNALGYASPALSVDGMEGPETLQAICRFQRKANLAVDGIAGPLTIAALQNAM